MRAVTLCKLHSLQTLCDADAETVHIVAHIEWLIWEEAFPTIRFNGPYTLVVDYRLNAEP